MLSLFSALSFILFFFGKMSFCIVISDAKLEFDLTLGGLDGSEAHAGLV